VLVPRSEVTVAPAVSGKEVLNVYGAVGVGFTVGVGRKKFGRVVPTVAEAEAKNEAIDSGDWISAGTEALRRGKKPIMGASFRLMP
jgi:hypothetical protein